MLASNLVTRAMRLNAIIADAEVPSATQMADGLLTLWRMVSGLEVGGIVISRPLVPWASTDIVALPDSLLEGLEALLALRIAPEYGMEARASVALIATEWLNMMRSITTVVPKMVVPDSINSCVYR
jgi:hypothetical protein